VGSYGEVWLAQHCLGMFRAVKVVSRSSFETNRPFERELLGIRQFEPISRSHDGFVDILHVGIDQAANCFYYVMELGDDVELGKAIRPDSYSPRTLRREISRRSRLSVRECADLGLAMCGALERIHDEGLVHRDVKPSNIIYAAGRPKLADIGLVTTIGEARSFVGTEGFIPPEGPGGPQADLFALGKVLYEASTGNDRNDFPNIPQSLVSSADSNDFAELNEVLLRACQEDRARRYASAREMGEDLILVLQGRSLRRLRSLEKRWEAAKRAMVVAGAAAAIAGLLGYEGYQVSSRRAAIHQRQIGEDIAYGNSALNGGDLLGSLPYFTDVLRLESGKADAEHSDRLRIGSILSQCPKLIHFWSNSPQLSFAEFSPDGAQLLTASIGGGAKLISVDGRAKTRAVGTSMWTKTATFSHDGRYLAIASQEKTAEIWDANTLALIARLPHPAQVQSARFNAVGTLLVTACSDGAARLFKIGSTNPVLTLQQQKKLWFADFSHDGKWIITAGEDNTARIWSIDGRLKCCCSHPTWVYYASFSPDDSRIVTACADHVARVFDISGQRVLPDLKHDDHIQSAEYSPDGRFILTASWDSMAKLWRADTLLPADPNPILRNSERLNHAAFSPDGRCIVTAGENGSLKIWDFAGCEAPPRREHCVLSDDGRQKLTIEDASVEVRNVETGELAGPPFSLDGKLEHVQLTRSGRFAIAVQQAEAAGSPKLTILDIHRARAAKQSIPLPSAEARVTASEDGKTAAVYWNKSIQIYDVATAGMIAPKLFFHERIDDLLFSPDGRTLAMQTAAFVRLWDVPTRRILAPSLRCETTIFHVDFNPQSSEIVVCCRNDLLTACYAQVFDCRTGAALGPRLNHRDGVMAARFDASGGRIGTAAEDFTAMIWNSSSGQDLIQPVYHKEKVTDVRFGPWGWFATTSDDKTARVWSAQTGDPLTPFLKDLVNLRQVHFSEGGNFLTTTDAKGAVRTWPLRIETMPPKDAVDMAQLLAKGKQDNPWRKTQTSNESPLQAWYRLRTAFPSRFVVSPDEILRWHEVAIEECETNNNWPAAIFHLQALSLLNPTDRSVAVRLRAAQDREP
jgi:WD40 repeat protein